MESNYLQNSLSGSIFAPVTFYQNTKHIKSRRSKRKLSMNNEQSNINYNDSLNSKNRAEFSKENDKALEIDLSSCSKLQNDEQKISIKYKKSKRLAHCKSTINYCNLNQKLNEEEHNRHETKAVKEYYKKKNPARKTTSNDIKNYEESDKVVDEIIESSKTYREKFYKGKHLDHQITNEINEFLSKTVRDNRQDRDNKSRKRSSSKHYDIEKTLNKYPFVSNIHRADILKTAVGRRQGTFCLRIIRKKSGFLGMYPKYELYDDSKSVFLANAKKMTGNQTSNYVISCEEKFFTKDRDSFIGKLRSNGDKSKYIIYDDGVNIENNKNASIAQIRCELGYVNYQINRNNLNGARNIIVALH